MQTIPVSKIDESYNTDRPDTLNRNEEINDYKNDRKGYLQDVQNDSSSMLHNTKVRKYFFYKYNIYRVLP